jgi:hypothetical protein
VVQVQPHLLQLAHAAGEDAVVEHDEGVVADRASLAQRRREADLGRAVGREVLHQQGALADGHLALDQGVAAEALGLLPHIGHGCQHAVGEPGAEGNAGRLAAHHHVDGFVAHVPTDLLHAELADAHPRAWEGDDLPAVDVDRAAPAGGEGVGLLRAEVHRLDLQQDARGGQRGVAVPFGGVAVGHGVGSPVPAHA